MSRGWVTRRWRTLAENPRTAGTPPPPDQWWADGSGTYRQDCSGNVAKAWNLDQDVIHPNGFGLPQFSGCVPLSPVLWRSTHRTGPSSAMTV